MATTIEHSTVLDARNQLTIGFKWDMQTLASRFNSEGLISDGCHETVTNPKTRYDESEKSTLMVADIVNRINLNKENYHKMMKILSSNQLQNGDLIRILDNIYTSKGGKCSYSIETVPPVYVSSANLWEQDCTLNQLLLFKYIDPKTNQHKEISIIHSLAYNWREIGTIIGFPDHIIKAIYNAGSGREPNDCMQEVMSKWLNNAPGMPKYKQYPDNWTGVYNLLMDALQSKLAANLCDAVNAQVSDLRGNYKKEAKLPVVSSIPPPLVSSKTPNGSSRTSNGSSQSYKPTPATSVANQVSTGAVQTLGSVAVLALIELNEYKACVRCEREVVTQTSEKFGNCTKCCAKQLMSRCKTQLTAKLCIEADQVKHDVQVFGKGVVQICRGKEISEDSLLEAEPFTCDIDSDNVLTAVRHEM